ncbi:MAG: type II toxin-antitoxin system RelE/ParE family toxin [Synergistaceae bacterium]|nr:type II toxin-antitoxin system RelE/ParE family toxin [Synergistaceae bacterium]
MADYKLIITVPALEDLNDIYKYISVRLNNPYSASKCSDKIFSSAKSLSLQPKRYRIRKKNLKGQEIRYMPVENFIIIYCVNDSERTVNILRIMYGKRNLDAVI